jgi:hypothetical protein
MFTQIADNFVIDIDFNKLEGIYEYEHSYGSPKQVIDEMHWMTYAPGNPLLYNIPPGNISFLWKMHKTLPDLAQSIVDRLRIVIGGKIILFKEQVSIIRTKGFVAPHMDEKRLSVINIGIKNTDRAVTRFSKTGNKADFVVNNTVDYTCQNGGVYILDVSKLHAVYPVNAEDQSYRYLFTYGFNIPYEELLMDLGRA